MLTIHAAARGTPIVCMHTIVAAIDIGGSEAIFDAGVGGSGGG